MMLVKQGGLRIRRGLPVLTAALLVLLFASPAQASGDDVWIPYEAGAEEPCSSPEIVPVVRIETELPPEPEPEQPLTPDGNLSLIDDITQTPASGEAPRFGSFSPSRPAPDTISILLWIGRTTGRMSTFSMK